MWVGIVLYYPKIDRLIKNIKGIINHIDGLILYDNGCSTECKEFIVSLFGKKIHLIGRGNNQGIATGLNEIMRFAQNIGIEWVITLDQDTIVHSNLIHEAQKRLNQDNVAIVCPRVVDKRRIYPANKAMTYANGDEYVEFCITSGSCIKVVTWYDVGGFDEFLFIDLVDNDMCKKIILSGKRILRMNDVEIDQEFGNIEPKSERTVEFFRKICLRMKNQKIAVNVSKLAYKKQVNPLRVYYTNRNLLYLNSKYKENGGIGYVSYSCNSYFQFMLVFNLASLLRGKKKNKIFMAIKRGIKDGKKAAAVFD